MNDKYFTTPLKGKRAQTPPAIMYFSWFPTYSCNYRCSYCAVQEVAHTPFVNPPGFKVRSPEEWEILWKKIHDVYGTAFIHVNGGEPFHYPNFIDIAERIARYHIMEFSTNLSFEVEDFQRAIPASRVYLIGCSYHPEFADFDEFVSKIIKLKENGYNARFNIVAYPPLLDTLFESVKKMKDYGISSTVLLFHGEHKGKKYPDSYNSAEKEKLERLIPLLGPEFKIMLKWSLRNKNEEEDAEKNENCDDGCSKEVICHMGYMYGRIHPDGEVIRCCAMTDSIVGNLFDKNFSMYKESRVCTNENCICWRHMVAGSEKEWEHGWPTPFLKKNEK